MKILILASNPRKDLNLDREIRDLKDVIEKSRNRQQFEVEDALAVRIGDLQDLLFSHRPQIVHFCGHGSGQQGLVFEGNDGEEQWVRAEALSDLFRLFSKNVGCVLLNACYSEEQANAIVNHIDYVIGMNQEIRDDAAIAFAKGFYRALGYECSIEQAYEFGKNAIQLEISGSSKMRSVTTEAQRKAEVVDAIQKIVIPEHLKPILRKKQIQTPLSIPTTPLSSETRTAIHLDVAQAVTKISSVKQHSARRLPQLLLSGLLVCFIPAISIYGYNQWQRHQLGQSVLQQEQSILQQAIELAEKENGEMQSQFLTKFLPIAPLLPNLKTILKNGQNDYSTVLKVATL